MLCCLVSCSLASPLSLPPYASPLSLLLAFPLPAAPCFLSRLPLHNCCDLCVANVWACSPAVCPLCVTVRTVTLSPFAWPPRLLHFPRVALRSLSRALSVWHAHALSRNRPIRCGHDSADHQVGCGSGRGRQGADAESSNTSIQQEPDIRHV